MKKSYKLLGCHWDRLPISKDRPAYYADHERIRDYKEEYDLLDLNGYKRRVSFSELLETESSDDVSRVINSVKKCDTIVIHADFFPLMGNRIVSDFLTKRLLQMYKLFADGCPDSNVYIKAGSQVKNLLESRYNHEQ